MGFLGKILTSIDPTTNAMRKNASRRRKKEEIRWQTEIENKRSNAQSRLNALYPVGGRTFGDLYGQQNKEVEKNNIIGQYNDQLRGTASDIARYMKRYNYYTEQLPGMVSEAVFTALTAGYGAALGAAGGAAGGGGTAAGAGATGGGGAAAGGTAGGLSAGAQAGLGSASISAGQIAKTPALSTSSEIVGNPQRSKVAGVGLPPTALKINPQLPATDSFKQVSDSRQLNEMSPYLQNYYKRNLRRGLY